MEVTGMKHAENTTKSTSSSCTRRPMGLRCVGENLSLVRFLKEEQHISDDEACELSQYLRSLRRIDR